MQSKPDDGLRPLITTHLPALMGTAIHWVNIESAMTASGIPDLEGCWRGRQVWIECKATQGWALSSLTEFQVGFALTRIRAGGRCLIITRRRFAGGPRREACDELWVHDGALGGGLRADGLRGHPPATPVQTGGPGGWDWELVGRAIFAA